MIEIIPSIILKEGKIVRTFKGDIQNITVYEHNPVDLAMQFEDSGIERLHLIDLDGAKKRKIVNYSILEDITRYTKLKVDFSGGISRDEDVRTAFEFGATMITVATVAMQEKEKFTSWLISYGREKIILAADALNGLVRTRGWQKNTKIDLMEHIAFFEERGIKYVKSTEVSRYGTQQGLDLALYKNILAKFPDLKILASGGLRSIEDIEALEKIGVYGVIFGKSFYEGKLKLKDLERFIVKKV